MIKEKINVLEKYRSKSTIVNPKINNVDVFSIAQDKDFAFVNYLKVMNGSVIQAHTVEIKKRLNESTSELLTIAIVDIREKVQSNAREIIIPEKIEIDVSELNIGESLHVQDISIEDAKIISKPDLVIVTVVPPSVIVEEVKAEEVEGEEVEGEEAETDEKDKESKEGKETKAEKEDKKEEKK